MLSHLTSITILPDPSPMAYISIRQGRNLFSHFTNEEIGSEWMKIQWIQPAVSYLLPVVITRLSLWRAWNSGPWSHPDFPTSQPQGTCAKSSPQFALHLTQSGCNTGACWVLLWSPWLPKTGGPSSCSAACLSVKPMQAPLPLLVSAGTKREVLLSHWLPHPQEGDFSTCRGIFLLLRPNLKPAAEHLNVLRRHIVPTEAHRGQDFTTAKLESGPEIWELLACGLHRNFREFGGENLKIKM